MNWHERIEQARKNNGCFTEEDVELADKWTTCACGEQDPELLTESKQYPWDNLLYELGLQFGSSVAADDVDTAEEELRRIQLRARYLLHLLHVDGVSRNIIEETHHLNYWTPEAEAMMKKTLAEAQ